MQGIFYDHPSLRPIFEPSMLKQCLTENSPLNNQLVGLYILRGMSYATLKDYVTTECYLSALKRNPTTLKGSWFHRPVPIERELEIKLSHCAASVGLTECLECYAGDLMKLVNNEGNSVMHTAAKDGSHDVLVYLIGKGYLTGILSRNQKGETPIILAKKHKHFKCMTLLEKSVQQDKKDLDELIAMFEEPLEVLPASKKKNKSKKCSTKRGTKNVHNNKTTPCSSICNDLSTSVEKAENTAFVPYFHSPQEKQQQQQRQQRQQPQRRLKKYIAKKIYSTHMELPMNKNIIQIDKYKEDGDYGIIATERVDGTLQDILRLPLDSLSIDVRVNLCKQILDGINALCCQGMCHGSINPENIFFIKSLGKITIKIGMVHLSGYQEKKPSPKNLFDPHELNIKGSRKDIFAAGCIFSLLLSNNHILGLEYEDQLENAKANNLKDSKWLQKCAGFEACDLVTRMIRTQESIIQCLSHPVFWKPKERFLFISEIVRRKKELPTNETLGVGEDWRRKIPPSGLLHSYVNSNNSRYGRSPKDLLRMLRNFYQHPPDTIEENNCYSTALKELEAFPRLFLKLYSVFGTYNEVLGSVVEEE